jgi:hypothetical protein
MAIGLTEDGTPVCPTHGPMRYRMPMDWWVCIGYDGEGCDFPTITAEEIARE